MTTEERVSLLDAAIEFHASSFESPVFWSRMPTPVILDELAARLDAGECVADQSVCEGVVLSPASSEHCFGFAKNAGIVVVFTAESAGEALDAYRELDEYLPSVAGLADPGNLLQEFRELVHSREGRLKEAVGDHISDPLSDPFDVEPIYTTIAFESIYEEHQPFYNFPWSAGVPIRLDGREDPSRPKKRGMLDVYRSDSGGLFVGVMPERQLGFVFDSRDVLHAFQLSGRIQKVILRENGSVAVATQAEDDSVIRCFDSDGEKLAEVSARYTPAMAFDNMCLCYERELSEVGVLNFETGAQETLRFDDHVERISESADIDGYEVSIGGPEPSHLVNRAGNIETELMRETIHGPALDVVNELLAGEQEPVWSVEFFEASRKSPEAFTPQIPKLVDALEDPTIRLSPEESRAYTALADGIPEKVAPHTEQLLGIVSDGAYPSDYIASGMLAELVQERIISDEVLEESKQLLSEDSHRLQKRGGRIAGKLAHRDHGDEEMVDLLTDRLKRYQPVDLCSVICGALNSGRRMDAELVDALVSKEKVGVLVDYSRWDTESRPMEVSGPNVSFEGSQAALDSRIAPIDEWLDYDPVDGLHNSSGHLLDLIAERRPELLLPHLDDLILNMGEEGDSMRYVRHKGRTVLSTLLRERPDGLTSAIDESAVVLREMLDHDDMASRQCAVRLLARGSSPTARQALDEIAAEPEHTLWTHLQSVSKEPGVEWEFGAEREETGRLSMLSDTASSLHVPTPSELARARAQQESRERDIAQQTSVNWKYIRKLEAGNVNPPLAKLAEIWAIAAASPDAFESFPTGGRVRNLRESEGSSVNALATESGVDESRLRQFEIEDGDLTCHEVESVLQSMSIESSAPAYPDRPPIHGTWVAFLEALTEALEEVPERSVARNFDETEGGEHRPDRDATAEFGIPEEMVPTEEFSLAFVRYNDLLDALDIETEYRVGGAPLRRDLISALREADDAVEGVATGADFQRETEYTTYNLSKEFGGIRAAREAAGTDKDSQSESTSERNTGSTSRASAKPERTREQLDEALVDLAESVDRTPTTTQMNEQGAFPTSAYYAEFDTWNEALESAGLTPRRSARSSGPTREELVGELQRLADDIGRPPKTTELKSKSEVSLNRYYTQYDSWEEALADAELLEDYPSTNAEESTDTSEVTSEQNSSGLIDEILAHLDED